jgi:hypothetical protein
MIDVHAPHKSDHTWTDFFIHIATIVVGLFIAIGLEQTAELIHHHHQRHQLEEDLREEAQSNMTTIRVNEKTFAIYLAWYRDVLKVAREAKPVAGFVTFVVPPRINPTPSFRPMDNVWPSAKASGAVAVLSRDEIEIFGRASTYAEYADQIAGTRNAALLAENAVLNRLGLSLAPGTTERMTPQDRDELMRAVANHMEGIRQLSTADAAWAGSSDAVLHGISSLDEMPPYVARAHAAQPK